jgi:hypothetical protein
MTEAKPEAREALRTRLNKFGVATGANPQRGADAAAQASAAAAARVANDPARDADRFKDQEQVAREIIRDQASPGLRREDFKGVRKQVAFRLRMATAKKVKMVLALKPGQGTEFFEAALDSVVDDELERLKASVDPAVWADATARVEAEMKR